MAEMDKLKRDRSGAQSAFTRRANTLSRTINSSPVEKLKAEWEKFVSEYCNLITATSDYVDALSEEGDAKQVDDVATVAGTCDKRFTEIEQEVKSALWSRFAEDEVVPRARRAERALDRAEVIEVDHDSFELCDVQRSYIQESIEKTSKALTSWKAWVPTVEAKKQQENVDSLTDRCEALWLRWDKEIREAKRKAAGRQTAEWAWAKPEVVDDQGEVQDDQGEEQTETVDTAERTPATPAPSRPHSPVHLQTSAVNPHPSSLSMPPGVVSPNVATGNPHAATPRIHLARVRLPTFTGSTRSFYRWRSDWESLQRQGEPTGSPEIKKLHLLDSLDHKIKQNLGLSNSRSADEIFRLLENRFGNKQTIACQIVEEVEKIPAVRGNQPRKTIDLIQAVERALFDLQDLGEEDALKNRLVIKSIESKLPDHMKRDWLLLASDPTHGITPSNHFEHLLKFLKKQEEVLERMEQLSIADTDGPGNRKETRKAFTKAMSGEASNDPCIMCGSEEHRGRLYACKEFRRLEQPEKRTFLKKSGVCVKCLTSHDYDSSCTEKFLCTKDGCLKGPSSDHHYLLCPKKKTDGSGGKVGGRGRRSKLTEDQEKFVKALPPNLLAEYKKAFTNKTTVKGCTNTKKDLRLNETREHPVIMMLMMVTANAGQKIGTLIDLASDTNYITHKAAKRLQLRGEDVTLVVQGVGEMVMTVATKKYSLRVRVKTPEGKERAHELLCYGLDKIAKVHEAVTPQQLKKFFPEVATDDLVRPKQIELLISHREGRLAPQRTKVIGDLVLWEGPLGKTVGGAHPSLYESVDVTMHKSKTHFARSLRTAVVSYRETPKVLERGQLDQHDNVQVPRSTTTANKEILDWWKWDSIGAACEPKCGGCRCGGCQPGGKEMTLGEERELEKIKEGLSYVTEDEHSKSPHWDAAYPWRVDPLTLPNNKRGVEATFLSTERRLNKDPEWKTAYAAQVHEMVARGAAVKLNKEDIDQWEGPVWYISHLIAPNPHSVTTPVRIVWNSSQEYKGMSMNSLLFKGPDVLNPIRGVLLRFRTGVHAALGDIKKMYNSVWLKRREVHLHRFLWRDSAEQDMEEYAITRVNIGDRPAGCIAQLAMRETARLPQFTTMKEERRVLEEDAYVDDILTSHNDPEALNNITSGVEKILNAGGFFLKPWVRSGQRGRPESKPVTLPHSIVLPNQMREEDNKALGLGYDVTEDKFHLMVSINFSRRKGKMRLGVDLKEDEIREKTPDVLTRRMLLSQVAGLYDPIGLVSPAKQKGAILVRKAFQEAGRGNLSKETWDAPLSPALREASVRLFEEYARLSQIRFKRCLTPTGWIGHPWGITFSDGSDDAYGAVLYLRWETKDGVVIRLVESKAKLTPLDQKGDAVKAEMCGAVFATRLRKYVEKHCRLEIERWIHLIDSQTVLGAIQKDSYGYQTFYANRIGEIQRAGPVDEWKWIEGRRNIADMITRGATPEELGEKSEWQNGPDFLRSPEAEWPVKSASDVSAIVSDEVRKLQRKAFSAVITRTQSKKTSGARSANHADTDVSDQSMMPNSTVNGQDSPQRIDRLKRSTALVGLVRPERFSTLSRLCGVTAWVRRAADTWLSRKDKIPGQAKWEAKTAAGRKPVLTLEDRKSAFQDLVLAAQDGEAFKLTTLNRLVVTKDRETGLLLCGGRVQSWRKDGKAVPLLPPKAWLGTLLAREAHERNHEGVAATLLRMRKRAWMVQGRRIVKKVINECITCRKLRAKMCEQVMSELPPERVNPAAPFEFTTLDLFGPFEVRDMVKKRTKAKVWGIVFCCMASRAVHADVVNDQSSESFLQSYARFAALRGHPRKLWSDRGTNFIGAKPALKELHKHLACVEMASMEDVAARDGTEWKWILHPADSPHRNGAAEAAVRILKRALTNLGGTTGNFTWSEFQTLLYSAANLANERPIDARAQEQEDAIEYVSPNSLILGRTGQGGDLKEVLTEGRSWHRLRAIQAGVDKFWTSWCNLAGPNLFIRPKWHRTVRNVQVGDLVWMADQNSLRGQFRLGKIERTYPDQKGVVRDVDIRTCIGLPATHSTTRPQTNHAVLAPTTVLRRDVRRLVVLLAVEEQPGNCSVNPKQ